MVEQLQDSESPQREGKTSHANKVNAGFIGQSGHASWVMVGAVEHLKNETLSLQDFTYGRYYTLMKCHGSMFLDHIMIMQHLLKGQIVLMENYYDFMVCVSCFPLFHDIVNQVFM